MFTKRTVSLLISLCTLLTANQALAWDISGVVVDPEGKPAPQASLWMSQNRVVQKAVTGSDGSFAYRNLSSGPITIAVYKDGLGVGGVEGQLLDDETVTLYLTRPATLSLDVQDDYSKPIVGARLKWLRVNDYLTLNMEDLVPLGFPPVRSDSSGVMTIPFLPVDGYAGVTISHARHAEAFLPAVPVGETIPMVMVEGVKLRGRVTSSDGAGVSRARVTVFRPGDDREYKFSEVLSDPEGFYSTTVPPAPYFVAVKHPEYGFPEPRPAIVEPDVKSVIVNVVMPRGYHISGTTVDGDNNPVKDAKVAYVVDGVIYAESLSDASGHYELMGNDGDAVLRITPPAGMIARANPAIPLHVDRGALKVRPIALLPLPSISGTVTTRDGSPVSDAIVHTQNTQPIVWTRTGLDGTFRFMLTRMQRDPVEVVAEHPTRFLRRESSVDLTKPKRLAMKLRSFRPDTERETEGTRNRLAHMLDKPAPDWACDAWFNLPDGMAHASLSDLKGRVVVLTLWGGFDGDGATRDRLRELNELFAAFRAEQDVFFLAIHDASLEPVEVEQFIRDWDIRIPVGCDADPFLSFDAYNVNVIPETVLIDKKGIVRYYNVEGRLHELIKVLRRD